MGQHLLASAFVYLSAMCFFFFKANIHTKTKFLKKIIDRGREENSQNGCFDLSFFYQMCSYASGYSSGIQLVRFCVFFWYALKNACEV